MTLIYVLKIKNKFKLIFEISYGSPNKVENDFFLVYLMVKKSNFYYVKGLPNSYK